MRNAGVVVIFFVVLIFLMYIKILPDVTWKELVVGYVLLVQMLFIIVISKQLEGISDKSEKMDNAAKALESKLGKIADLLEKSEAGGGGSPDSA